MSMQSLKEKGKGFTEKHGEIWKFIKWSLLTGVGASGIELIVHMLLLNYVFGALHEVPITNAALVYIKVTDAGYLYSFLISSTIGYSIAFIVNRKITFKADSNPAVSAVFAILLIIFNIFATTWIGTVVNTSAAQQWGALGDVLIKIATMTIPSVWVYPANRFIIHRVKKKPAAETAAEPVEQ